MCERPNCWFAIPKGRYRTRIYEILCETVSVRAFPVALNARAAASPISQPLRRDCDASRSRKLSHRC